MTAQILSVSLGLLSFALGGLPRAVTAAGLPPEVRRILFLGDSITYDGRYVADVEAWLATQSATRTLEVLNLGLPSETVSGLSEVGHAGGQFPRPDLHERLGRVLQATKPDLVFACYGMNDGIYLPLDQGRFLKFQEGTRRLHEAVVAAGAKIVHLTPPVFDPVPLQGRTSATGPTEQDGRPYANYNEVLDRYSAWLLDQRTQGWEVVDLHGPVNRFLSDQRQLKPDFTLAGDGVHPGEAGHWLMAKPILLYLGATGAAAAPDAQAMLAATANPVELLKWVRQRMGLLRDAWLTTTGHKRPGMGKGEPLPLAQAKAAELARRIQESVQPNAAEAVPPFPGKPSQWHGFDRHDFPVAGRTLSVIVPKQPKPGRRWAWKGEFLDAFPDTEIALLGRGLYLVYYSTPDLLGSPQAVAAWNVCYQELTGQYGLAKKTALIGLSRGGLYCYNWAAANPEKVACIYADAPVCDFKSWPGGRPKGSGKGQGSARDWQLVLDRYGFKNDAEAIAYGKNPVDNLAPLAAAKVPLIHVYGDADPVVPWEENTGVLAERYKRLGGSITLIGKPGVGHHPHGLKDPTPVVDFIVRAVGGLE